MNEDKPVLSCEAKVAVGTVRRAKARKAKGTSEGKGNQSKDSVSELPISADLTTTHQQCLHWRPQPVKSQESSQRNDDCKYEESEIVSTFGAIRGIAGHDPRKRWNRSNHWHTAHVFVLNCADEHVCSLQHLDCIEVRQSRDPNLDTASERMALLSFVEWTQQLDHVSSCARSKDPPWLLVSSAEQGTIVVKRSLKEVSCGMKPRER